MTTRRNFLLATGGAAAAAAVGGCSILKTGSTTTLSINVGEVLGYTSDVLTGAAVVLAIPGVTTALSAVGLGGAVALLSTAQAAEKALANAVSLVGGKVTLSIDTTSFSTQVQSITKDVGTVLGDADTVVGSLTGTVAADIAAGIGAAQSLTTTITTALGLSGVSYRRPILSGVPELAPDDAKGVIAALKAKYGVAG